MYCIHNVNRLTDSIHARNSEHILMFNQFLTLCCCVVAIDLEDDTALPVARASDQAKKTLHPNSVPSNGLLRRVGLWKDEYGQEDL